MTSPTRLMSAGMPAGQAVQIGQASAIGLIATGTTKAGALVLASNLSIFATVATAGAGAILPRAEGQPAQVIANQGAGTLSVYARGASGSTPAETINALTTGAAFSVATGKVAVFWPSQAKPGYVVTLTA